MNRAGALCAAVVIWRTGCCGLGTRQSPCASEPRGLDPQAKTLLQWSTPKEEEPEPPEENGAEKNGNGPEDKPNGKDKPVVPAQALFPVPSESAGLPPGFEPEAEEPLTTDRPDFTEASSTVGRGRVQFELGYTYFRDTANGVRTETHSYPELLVRLGLFADWFELRVGQNFSSVRSRPGGTEHGAQDLYLGTKLALTEQAGLLPESALILQMTVPSGSRAFTSDRVLPGVSYLYSWELTDRLTLAGSILANAAVDDTGRSYTEVANSFSLGMSWTERLGSYVEYFGFYPHGTSVLPHPGTVVTGRPQYFLNGGCTFLATPNLQFDIRAGLGLNQAAEDFFTGAGLAYRY